MRAMESTRSTESATEAESISIIDTTALPDIAIDPYCVECSADNVPVLLQLRPEWADRRHAWHDDILDRLHTIDPHSYELFKEREQQLPKVKLRLISPTKADAPQVPRYDALSYTWHRASWTPTPELLNGDNNSLVPGLANPTCPPMWRLLLTESAKKGNMIWADQICINQSDEDEKKIAVGFTDRVYQNSERVFIAIEDISIDEQWLSSLERAAHIRKGSAGMDDLAKLSGSDKESLLDFCLTLFGCRWPKRAWCLHEFQCSDRHVMFIPLRQTNAGPLRIVRLPSNYLETIINATVLSTRNPGEATLLRMIERHEAYTRMIEFGTRLLFGTYGQNFIETHMNVFKASARQKTDQMAITLNSVSSGLLYVGPALQTQDEIFQLTYSVALAAGDASAFGVSGPILAVGKRFLSTWLRVPSNRDWRHEYRQVNEDPTACNVKVTDTGVLELDMIILGRTEDIEHPQQSHLDVACAFMELDLPGRMDSPPFVRERRIESTQDSWDANDYMLRFFNHKFFYAQALACLLSLPDDAHFFSIIRVTGARNSRVLDSADEQRLNEVFQWLRAQTETSDSNALRESKPDTVTETHVSSLTMFLNKFVHQILGMKDMYNINVSTSWQDFTIGFLKSEALSISNIPIIVPRASRAALIAVPADVTSENFSMLRRVWILNALPDLSKAMQNDGTHEGNRADDEDSHSYFEVVYKTMLVGWQEVKGNKTFMKIR